MCDQTLLYLLNSFRLTAGTRGLFRRLEVHGIAGAVYATRFSGRRGDGVRVF